MTTYHKNLRGDDYHPPGYIRATDPGVVGSGILWVDKTGGAGAWELKIRNDADNAWETPKQFTGVTVINQSADDLGLQIYGFDDVVSDDLRLYIDEYGIARIYSDEQMIIQSDTSFIRLNSQSNISNQLADVAGLGNFQILNSGNYVTTAIGPDGRMALNASSAPTSAKMLLINQAGDNEGVEIYGYDDVSDSYLKSYVDDGGDAFVVSSGNMTVGTPYGNVQFIAGSGALVDIGDTTTPMSIYGYIGPLEEFRIRDTKPSPNDLFTLAGDGNIHFKRTVEIPLLDNATDLATGDDFPGFYWCVPESLNGYNITDVDFYVTTVSSSGLPSFDIYNVTGTGDVLTVNCTIDVSDFTSYGATTPPTINTSEDDLTTGDLIRFDCDVAGTGTKGCGVILVVEKP